MTTCGFPPRCPFCWVAIVLLLPYRPSCPIAFRPDSAHRPAIARRLPPWESRRQSPLVPSSRPACRIDERGDALGTGRGTGRRTGSGRNRRGAAEKPIGFSTISGRLSRTSLSRQMRGRHTFHTVSASKQVPVPFFSQSIPLDFDSVRLAVGVCDRNQLISQFVYIPCALKNLDPYL